MTREAAEARTESLGNGAGETSDTSLPIRTFRSRYKIGVRSYGDLLDVVTQRDITDPWIRVPARIETYMHQAASGRRPLKEALSKISIYMNWVEKKYPDVFDWLTTQDETHLKPLMQMRNAILPPPRKTTTGRSPRR